MKEFRSTQEAFKLLGFTAKEQGNIYKILAGILQVNLLKNPLHISMSLNFPAKKLCAFHHLKRKCEDERTESFESFSLNYFLKQCQRKTYPDKNWRKF